MSRILVVDDDQKIRSIIMKYSLYENHFICEAKSGSEALKMLKTTSFEIIILDINMPRMDGFSVLEKIRAYSNIPVIMLSCRNEEKDIVKAFNLGADDYVTKPFSPSVLMCRIKTILKRYYYNNSEVFRHKRLAVDLSSKTVKINDKEVKFTQKSFNLLALFINNIDIVIPCDEIYNSVCKKSRPFNRRTLTANIRTLRKKLGEYGKLIKTVRGIGYKFTLN